jgi:DNA-binding MarR family transcriptional regulator
MKTIYKRILENNNFFSVESDRDTFRVMLNYFNGNSEAQISNGELHMESNYSMSTILRSIDRLIEKGLIGRSRGYREGTSQWDKTLYWLEI